jgi:hypothetical protein
MSAKMCLGVTLTTLCLSVIAAAPPAPATESTQTTKLADIRMRDVCILPDQASKTYYMVGPGFRTVRVFTSKDLATWEGPRTIFRPPADIWGDVPVVGI